MNAILVIARNTLREALRERLLYNLLVFAVILIGSSLTISQLTLGDQFRIIADVSTASTQIFGTLIAVFLSVALVSRELDRRTSYPALSRPITRGSFLGGKALGLLAVVTLNGVVMALASLGMLALYAESAGGVVPAASFAAAFALMVVQFAICIGFAVLFSSFTTPTLATVFTLAFVVAGHVFSGVRVFWLTDRRTQLKGLVRVLDFVLPNMGLLDLKEAVTYRDAVSWGTLAWRSGYGLAYAAVLVLLGALVFARRDVR
jgi:ABC-type transport system involved in multi-copper enzyme maturation permease subunit